MDPGGSSESDVKPSGSGYAVLQNRANRFVDSLDVGYDRKSVKDDFKVLSLTRRMTVPSSYQEGCGKSKLGGKGLKLVLGVLKCDIV